MMHFLLKEIEYHTVKIILGLQAGKRDV